MFLNLPIILILPIILLPMYSGKEATAIFRVRNFLTMLVELFPLETSIFLSIENNLPCRNIV